MPDSVDSSGHVIPSRVLVTGADGLIGRAVVAHLLRVGYAVTALSLRWSLPIAADRVFTGDAGDELLVRAALEDVDAVIHLAATPHPDIDTPRAVFVGNTAATFTVLAEAGGAGIKRAVIASSINAFGVPMNRHEVAPAYYPLDELTPIDHDDAYSLSKWVDEHTALWAHSRWGMDVAALRFPLVRPLPELQEIARVLRDDDSDHRRLAREGWAYLELSDAVDAIERAITQPFSGAHTLLLAAADTLLDEPTELLLDRYAPSVQRHTQFFGTQSPVDTSAAERLLGWVPRHSISSHWETRTGARS